MLTIDNLSCSRGNNILFKNLGITLGDNCILVIRGENGCGKTTLLETITCLRKAAAGRILYANKDVSGEHFREYCDIIQYIGHKTAIKPQLTVKENIEFWASLKGNIQAVQAAISFWGLKKYENTICAALSAGYQKRVALAKLMVTNATIWLLDEPFVNLDEDGKNTLATLIASRCERGGTVVVTAHGEVPFVGCLELDLGDFQMISGGS